MNQQHNSLPNKTRWGIQIESLLISNFKGGTTVPYKCFKNCKKRNLDISYLVLVFEHLKIKLRVFSTGWSVAMVTCNAGIWSLQLVYQCLGIGLMSLFQHRLKKNISISPSKVSHLKWLCCDDVYFGHLRRSLFPSF